MTNIELLFEDLNLVSNWFLNKIIYYNQNAKSKIYETNFNTVDHFSGLTNCSSKLNISELKDYKSIENVKIGMPINTAIGIAKKKHFKEKKKGLYMRTKKKNMSIQFIMMTQKSGFIQF